MELRYEGFDKSIGRIIGTQTLGAPNKSNRRKPKLVQAFEYTEELLEGK